MIINSSIIVRSSPPITYITQPGAVGPGDAGGSGGGGGDNSGDDDDSSGGGDSSDGGNSVVKAPTALQAL